MELVCLGTCSTGTLQDGPEDSLFPVLFSSKTFKKKFRQGLTDLYSQIAACRAPECWDSSCNILGLMLVPCTEALSGKDGGIENNAFSAPRKLQPMGLSAGKPVPSLKCFSRVQSNIWRHFAIISIRYYAFTVDVCFSVLRKIKGRNVPI